MSIRIFDVTATSTFSRTQIQNHHLKANVIEQSSDSYQYSAANLKPGSGFGSGSAVSSGDFEQWSESGFDYFSSSVGEDRQSSGSGSGAAYGSGYGPEQNSTSNIWLDNAEAVIEDREPVVYYMDLDSLLAPLLAEPVPVNHAIKTFAMNPITNAYNKSYVEFRPFNLTKPLNGTANVTVLRSVSNRSRLCGVPGFCSSDFLEECTNTVMTQCDECSMAGAALFATLAVLLAILILCGNGMVIKSSMEKNKKSEKDFFSKIKCSLALADMLTGLEILCVAMYNFSWTINSTANQLDQRQFSLRGSPQAIAGGIFYLLGFTSSHYHLVFLGIQRLYAIWRPMRYRMQSTTSLHAGIALTWVLAVLTATVPLWFPDVFTFTYVHTIFIFYVTMTNMVNPKRSAETVAVSIITIVTPFTLMTIVSILTGFIGHRKVTRGRRLQGSARKRRGGSRANREMNLFKTVALMQLGFTVTLVPVMVATLLSYTNEMNCRRVSVTHLLCFYVSMINSLVNVVVYSARDKGFRMSVHKFICKSWFKTKRERFVIT